MAGRTTLAGIDDQGREVLSFIDGHVAREPGQPPEVRSEESLVAVARLVRQFHDLTAGTELAHDQEVACHNDLSPKNTVYRDLGADLRPTAFIDWDLAAPGARIHDVAHVCWQYIGLGPGADITHTARLVAVIADAYGPVPARSALVAGPLLARDRRRRGRRGAGDGALARTRRRGRCAGGARMDRPAPVRPRTRPGVTVRGAEHPFPGRRAAAALGSAP
jgi:Phosphotransferase enzyme family